MISHSIAEFDYFKLVRNEVVTALALFKSTIGLELEPWERHSIYLLEMN
jgi:hypothetical protein